MYIHHSSIHLIVEVRVPNLLRTKILTPKAFKGPLTMIELIHYLSENAVNWNHCIVPESSIGWPLFIYLLFFFWTNRRLTSSHTGLWLIRKDKAHSLMTQCLIWYHSIIFLINFITWFDHTCLICKSSKNLHKVQFIVVKSTYFFTRMPRIS